MHDEKTTRFKRMHAILSLSWKRLAINPFTPFCTKHAHDLGPPDPIDISTRPRYPDDTATQAVKIVAARGISSSSNNNNVDADNAAATAGDDPGYEATAAAVAASTALVLGNDTSLPLPEALAWCALHARAAMMAEESLAIQLAESDSKVKNT